MLIQPLLYTRQLIYPEIMTPNDHNTTGDVVNCSNVQRWVKASSHLDVGEQDCWMCQGHTYTHITLRNSMAGWELTYLPQEKPPYKNYPILKIGNNHQTAMLPLPLFLYTLSDECTLEQR